MTLPRRRAAGLVRQWRAVPPLQRLASCVVAVGFFIVVVTDFTAIGTEDRPPSLFGLLVGAGLLLLAAPWRWRRAGYVALWGFSVLITNNTLSTNDASWNGIPGSLLVIALMMLWFWMSHRDEERRRGDQPEPSADLPGEVDQPHA